MQRVIQWIRGFLRLCGTIGALLMRTIKLLTVVIAQACHKPAKTSTPALLSISLVSVFLVVFRGRSLLTQNHSPVPSIAVMDRQAL